jgi:hypothetical protein
VCWDNWFVVPSLNRGLTAACRRADGSTVPATGILALRELAKRTFQSMHEQDLLPITMTRLHAASILPLLGFATVQSDGGGEPATGDAQDRFPRERVLLVSTGELAGTWPVLPGPAGKLPGDAWTQRTWIAASLVHELSPTTAAWQSRDAKAWQPLVKPVLELLDAPELQVYRYWDERPQPVTANHPDLPTIVYSVPGREAIVAVTSYARQDVDAILTVAPPGLGFATLGPAVDVETGEALPLTGNRLNFRLRKHDVREFRLSPAADSSRRSPAGEGG